jgi:hypothetical protein
MPHLLIAGAKGSGKSVCINTLIMSILYKSKPSDVRMIMVDPKVVELNVYNGIPHLLIPVVTDPKKAAAALNWAVAEMTERFGFAKMQEWNESPDLLYYYKHIFGEDCEKHIETCDMSFYKRILRGEQKADENTNLSLMVDDKYKIGSRLEVFYSAPTLTKAAIKYGDSVLGLADITTEGVSSYVTDYSAW